MAGGGRRTPFSGKKKKQQLQDKRQRKAEKGDEKEEKHLTQDEIDKITNEMRGTVVRHSAESGETKHNDLTQQGRGRFTLSNAAKLRTVFEKEPRELVELRKMESRLPIVRDPTFKGDSFYSTVIDIPKRPPWHYGMTKEEVEGQENSMFERYLEGIYSRFPIRRLNFFEHNLEVWRQLWRVCEVSDVLMILADIRHPMFHFPPALYNYVVKDLKKHLILVLTKADLVPTANIAMWKEYFENHFPGLRVVPYCSFEAKIDPTAVVTSNTIGTKKKRRPMKKGYSPTGVEDLMAVLADLRISKKGNVVPVDYMPPNFKSSFEHPNAQSMDITASLSNGKEPEEDEKTRITAAVADNLKVDDAEDTNEEEEEEEEEEEDEEEEDENDAEEGQDAGVQIPRSTQAEIPRKHKRRGHNWYPHKHENHDAPRHHHYFRKTMKLLVEEDEEQDEDAKQEESKRIEEAMKEDHYQKVHEVDYLIVGLIGNPNVGKSTFINAMKGRKVCSTSRTPGHTKWKQTIFLNKNLMLVDCPGLVFPAVDMPKQLQILCGIFPIAQVREPFSALQYMCRFVPLEQIYNLQLEDARDSIQYDPEKYEIPWSAWMIAEAYAAKRGYHTRRGLDVHRAGLEILFDIIDGRIVLYFLPNQGVINLGAFEDPTSKICHPLSPTPAGLPSASNDGVFSSNSSDLSLSNNTLSPTTSAVAVTKPTTPKDTPPETQTVKQEDHDDAPPVRGSNPFALLS